MTHIYPQGRSHGQTTVGNRKRKRASCHTPGASPHCMSCLVRLCHRLRVSPDTHRCRQEELDTGSQPADAHAEATRKKTPKKSAAKSTSNSSPQTSPANYARPLTRSSRGTPPQAAGKPAVVQRQVKRAGDIGIERRSRSGSVYRTRVRTSTSSFEGGSGGDSVGGSGAGELNPTWC